MSISTTGRDDTTVKERRLVLSGLRRQRPAAMFDLDVGVIYSGERHFMTPLVTTLTESAAGLAVRLILVDNASPDGVATWTRLGAPAKIVTNERALGYAANLNRILSASDARYVLLLNTDMYFDPSEQCLAKMVAFMDARPRCGIGICRVFHPDGTDGFSARRFPTLRAIVSRRLGLRRIFSRSYDEHVYRGQDAQAELPCDWVSGCFMMVRRDAIRQVGRFDEGFLKYFEDVDMCQRMAQAGWQVMRNGATSCFHYEQRASRNILSRDAYVHVWSYLRWRWKQTARPRSGLPPSAMLATDAERSVRADAAHRQLPPAHGRTDAGENANQSAAPHATDRRPADHRD